jgi:hypothetical protein
VLVAGVPIKHKSTGFFATKERKNRRKQRSCEERTFFVRFAISCGYLQAILLMA